MRKVGALTTGPRSKDKFILRTILRVKLVP
jgi:hypothetical protein